jgi:hypothetical protein
MKQFNIMLEIIYELIKKRLEIRNIYKMGIGLSFSLLRYILPIIAIILFLTIIDILNLNKEDIINMIKQLNSLIGIILGFSIASFAIFISINNDKLEEKSKNTEFTYRKIGSSLFFYNVEISLFISIIGIFLTFIDLPNINILNIIDLVKNYKIINGIDIIKISCFLLYLFMFFQLIFNLFYSSIFLNSSIKK